MEKILLPEKAVGFVRKIVPVCTRAKFESVPYPDIQESANASENIVLTHSKVFGKSNIKALIFALLFVLVAIFSAGTFLVSSSEIGREVREVVEKLFEPRDIGKIKFANGDTASEETESEAMSKVASFGLPFASCMSKNLGSMFLVASAGEITVKCAMKGVVEFVETNESNFQKTITVKHGAGLKTIYSMIDIASVKVGDSVEKNTILGLSQSGEIGFQINYKNKIIKGLEIVDGQLSFT